MDARNFILKSKSMSKIKQNVMEKRYLKHRETKNLKFLNFRTDFYTNKICEFSI